MKDSWHPKQYYKFEAERTKPFLDLISLIQPKPNMNVLDMGCGTGKPTLVLHNTLKAKHTLGIDASEAMLKEAFALKQPGLNFQMLDVEKFNPSEKYDLIFSNAAFHWFPNHEKIMEKLPQYLTNNGQIAIQLSATFDYPTHAIAKEVAKDPLFAADLKGSKEPSSLPVEEYAKLLFKAGAKEQSVRLYVYPYVLESTNDAVEWLKGSFLTFYQSRLSETKFQEYLNIYSRKIHEYFGEQKPFFFPFKRILIWAQF